MIARPILMTAPMIKALLAGTKTQTRLAVKITHRTPGLAACLEPADPAWARPHQSLWESINGRGSWDANPWVWRLQFNVIQRNVDEVIRAAA